MDWLDDFKSNAKAKFELMQPESSQTFIHNTFFKDFELPPDRSGSISFDENMMREAVDEGVIVKPLDQSLDEIKDFLGKKGAEDKFLQMNNAFFSAGIFIKVPKGLQVENDLRVYSETRGSVFYKIIVVAEEGSGLNIVKEDFSKGGSESTVSESIEIFLADGSSMKFSDIQNHGDGVDLFSNKMVECGRGSNASWNMGNFGGRKVRSRVHNIMRGEGSSVEELEVSFGGGEQAFDTFSALIHEGRRTNGRILSKGVMKDRSQSLFKGMIRIEDSAKNASSYLAGHSMLLSKSAKAQAIPGLEILTNDVKATHSASVSPIDDEKIFYLESRGLDREESVKTISLGFMEPVLARIGSEEIRSKIRLLMDLKWKGEQSKFAEMLKKAESDRIENRVSRDMFEGHYKYR